MRQSLLKILRSPYTKEPLLLYPFESELSSGSDVNVLEGILVGERSKNAYPITNSIPVMIEGSFTEEFLKRHAGKIAEEKSLAGVSLRYGRNSSWSFSDEWNEHFKANLTKTWGWTIRERVEQFCLETNITLDDCKGKLILDAGCGNGQLSEAIAELGALVVGVDYSNSVFTAEKHRRSLSVHFIQGDLESPPFASATFDLIISNGVLHHTPDTYKTFVSVAQLAKPGGRFYLWLYRKSEKFLRRYVFLSVIETMRTVVARLPARLQTPIVKAYAAALTVMHSITGKYKGERHRSWAERVVETYDTLTPRFRHYHTPLQVSCWFFLNGYFAPTLTHWDNPHGFGVVATKIAQKHTPGVNYGKKGAGRRQWK